ncbi:MAG: hypothetical protein LBG19_13315 [Prevotellaceae bacterium]|jgi:hypothetical protein|nr:hypothetical protein [Prevotellaceae bacterium]
MYKYIFTWLLFSFSSSLLVAQGVIIEGKLTSPDSISLSGVNVIIHPQKNTESIIAYGFSDENGNFRISVNHNDDSISVSIKSMQSADTVLYLRNLSQKLDIPLGAKDHLLNEARVSARPIYRKGDTTVYSVQAFALKQDFSIGDVIKKMPGFDVDDNGRISYQGQNIQKYYIEGLDLLGSGYTIANNNLPHASVSSVEILHDHQPIKAIDGIISSSNTSLNIKLKHNVAVTGRAQAGAGFSPLLWDINLTPMLFSKSQQAIGSWQSNNVGNNIGAQHRINAIISGSIDGATTMKSDFVAIPNISLPPVAQNKYLDNEANLTTYNHLVKLSPATELKINGSYYHDNIDEESYMSTSYFTQDSVISICEHQKNLLHRNSLITNLGLTQNTESRYLFNKVSFGRFWDADNAQISNGAKQNIKAILPHTTIANTFDMLIPIKSVFLRVESVVDYNDYSQSLVFTPGVFITNNDLEQQVSNQNFITTNKLSFSFPIKSFQFGSSLGVDYEKQKNKTSVLVEGIPNAVDSLSNSLEWQKTDMYIREDIEYRRNDFIFKVGLPLQYSKIDIIDKIHGASNNMNCWFFKPSAFIQYKPTGSLTGSLAANYSKILENINNLLVGNIIVNHRLTRSNQARVSFSKSAYLLAGITYQNPANGFFADIKWTTSNSKKELMLNQISQGNGLFIYKYERKDGTTKVNNLSSEVSLYMNSLKTTIGAKGEFTRNDMEYLSAGQSETMKRQMFAITPKALFSFSKHFSLSYSYRLAKTKTYIANSYSTFFNQKHKFDIYLYIANNHLIGIESELYYTRKTGLSTSQTLFSNISYSFKPSNSRINLKLECRNLLNTSRIAQIHQSDITLLYTEYYLRPRQFLLTAMWSLGIRKK